MQKQIEFLQEEYNISEGDALYYYCDNFHIALEEVDEEIISQFEDSYEGVFSSIEDYAMKIVEETGLLTDANFMGRYFDYKKFARDMILSGDVWTEESGGDVYVYVSR